VHIGPLRREGISSIKPQYASFTRLVSALVAMDASMHIPRRRFRNHLTCIKPNYAPSLPSVTPAVLLMVVEISVRHVRKKDTPTKLKKDIVDHMMTHPEIVKMSCTKQCTLVWVSP